MRLPSQIRLDYSVYHRGIGIALGRKLTKDRAQEMECEKGGQENTMCTQFVSRPPTSNVVYSPGPSSHAGIPLGQAATPCTPPCEWKQKHRNTTITGNLEVLASGGICVLPALLRPLLSLLLCSQSISALASPFSWLSLLLWLAQEIHSISWRVDFKQAKST